MMNNDGYLQIKIREQNEKIIELGDQINQLIIRLKQLESLPSLNLQQVLEENNRSSKRHLKDNIDKQINQKINNLTFKIQKINRHSWGQILKALNTVTKNLEEGQLQNLAGVNTIFSILHELKIINISEEELNKIVKIHAKILEERRTIKKTTIHVKEYEEKMLFDFLKEKNNDF